MLTFVRIILIAIPISVYGNSVAVAQFGHLEAIPAPAPPISSEPNQLSESLATEGEAEELSYLQVRDQELINGTRSPDDIQASTSLIYLTCRAVEDPNSVAGNSQINPHLYEFTCDLVKEFALHESRTRQSAAAQCIKYLLTSASNPNRAMPLIVGDNTVFKWVLDEFAITYQQTHWDNLKLAFLGAASESLKADLDSFIEASDDIDAAGAILRAKKIDLAGITLINFQLDEFLGKATSASLSVELRKDLSTKSGNLLEKYAKVDSAQDLVQAYNLMNTDLQLVEQFLCFAEREALTRSGDNRLIASVVKDFYKNKLLQFKLEQEVDAIKKKIAKLKDDRGDEILKRHALAVLDFLKSTQQGTDSKLVREVANGLSASASSALIKYFESKAYDDAAVILAVKSGSFLTPGEIGARMSAGDIPSATDGRTSGSRPGVSSTAPFDPAVDPKKPSQFPQSDYRGKRKPSTDPFPENSLPPKKAAGAAGATPAG
jgi:hypothetical protein